LSEIFPVRRRNALMFSIARSIFRLPPMPLGHEAHNFVAHLQRN
jgi:hypothetical protein